MDKKEFARLSLKATYIINSRDDKAIVEVGEIKTEDGFLFTECEHIVNKDKESIKGIFAAMISPDRIARFMCATCTRKFIRLNQGKPKKVNGTRWVPTAKDIFWVNNFINLFNNHGVWISSAGVYKVDKDNRTLWLLEKRNDENYPEETRARNVKAFGAIGWKIKEKSQLIKSSETKETNNI